MDRAETLPDDPKPSLVLDGVTGLAHPTMTDNGDVARTGPQPSASELEMLPPPQIPGFEFEKELGRGGMGVVFKARQVALNRPVAVKMILSGAFAGSQERQRFLAEAEAIAKLQHPGIVQIHEFGTHGPHSYFAMEFVEGGSLEGRLRQTPLASRLAALLTRRLAEAIEAAHEHGIVHRDLKPGNILLAQGPGEEEAADLWPKITDFGVAKATGSNLTATGEVIGTPNYMAPEQAAGRGNEIGPATDVYALGTILYECLTGRPPFCAATVMDTIMQVIHTEPIGVRQLQPRTPKDLETICLRCLQKDPDKRYARARDLADDLGRFLRGEPIQARPVGRLERTLKWCRRYPAVAALLLLAFLTTLTTSGLAWWALDAEREAQAAAVAERQAKQAAEHEKQEAERAKQVAERERDEKEQQRRYAQAIADFVQNDFLSLTSVEGQERFGDADAPLGKDATLRQLLDRAADKLRQRRDLDPLIAADLNWIVGVNYHALGEDAAAVEFLEKAWELRKEQLGAHHKAARFAQSSLGVAYTQSGRLPEAIRLLEELHAVEVANEGGGYAASLASANNLAEAYMQVGRLPDVLRLLEPVLHDRARFLESEPNGTLVILDKLANAYTGLGRIDDAIKLYREVRAIQLDRLGPEHTRTLRNGLNLASAYRVAGRHDAALRLLKETLPLMEKTLGRDHIDTLTGLQTLAQIYSDTGSLEESVALREEIKDTLERRLGHAHPATLRALNSLGYAYRAQGRFAEALAVFEGVLKTSSEALGPDHPSTLTTMGNVAATLWSLRRLDESVPMFEEIVKRKEAVLGPNHPSTLMSVANLGVNYLQSGRVKQALPLLAQSYAASRGQHDFRWVGDVLLEAYVQAEQGEAAAKLVEELIVGDRAVHAPGSIELAANLASRASVLLEIKAYAAAEAVLREVLAIRTEKQPQTWTTFNTMSMLAGALLGQVEAAQKNVDPAEQSRVSACLQEAEKLLLAGYQGLKERKAALPPQSRFRLRETCDRLIALYTALDRPAEVARWREEKATLSPD